MNASAVLEWYIEAGVDEAIGEEPVNHFAPKAPAPKPANDAAPVPKAAPTLVTAAPNSLHHTPSAAIAAARTAADACETLADLEAAVRAFDGCAIKKAASKTVFADGNPKAKVMIIGEAPGVQEDIQGIPFCGPSGHLLDRMLAAIGLSRQESAYISNTIFWRPPGNRQPSPEETATCLPFVEKHIALINPALLILAGGTATSTLMQRDQSISRLRGKIYEYTNPYLAAPLPTILMYHPSYLLRQPGQKKLAWNDLILVREFLLRNNISH